MDDRAGGHISAKGLLLQEAGGAASLSLLRFGLAICDALPNTYETKLRRRTLKRRIAEIEGGGFRV